ncbi:MAG TPA: ATP-binding protein [Paracoccaceae bacterium]|nr:ATP-binding protein [Paracoccaceae bacterium]
MPDRSCWFLISILVAQAASLALVLSAVASGSLAAFWPDAVSRGLAAGMLVLLVQAQLVFRPLQGRACSALAGMQARAEAAETAAARAERRLAAAEAAREAAESALQVRAAFLASMSHELRTPLNGVLGVADLLARSGLDANQERLVAIVRDSGETLMALINDLLDVEKMEQGRLLLEEIRFVPAEIIAKAAAMHALRAEEKGIGFVLDIAPGLDRPLIGDPVRLRQVLHNLLSNAVKFTEAGEVRLAARLEPDAGGRRELTVTVSDTGIGMSEEQRGLVFQPFAQADRSIARRYGGTGLGLAICHKLCELMRGSIEVTSVLGRGSTFRFGLPLRLAEAPAGGEVRAHGRPQPGALQATRATT